MDFALSPKQIALQEEIRAFAQGFLNENIAERDKAGTFPHELWLACGEKLMQGLAIAQDFGGRGLGPLDTVLAFEAFGYGCQDNGLAFAIGAQLFACNIPIWLHGSTKQKANYLPQLCSGQLIATNAMTEEQGGSAAFDMKSKAEKTNKGYRLSAFKSYCANAPVADLCLVYLPTNPEKGFFGGISAFLLDIKQHNFRLSESIDKLGLRTCSSGKILLDQLEVDASTLLGKEGAGALIFTQSMQWERIGLSALHLGSMKHLLEQAVLHVNGRGPGGIALSKHQAISHRLAEMQVHLEASKLLVYQAAWKLQQKQQVNYHAAISKLFTSEHYKHMCMELLQIYGGIGYDFDHEISRNLRDAAAATIYSGTSEIQKNIIARSLGLKI